MTAPTPAEIRAIVDQAEIDVGESIYQATSMVSYVPPSVRGPAYVDRIWDDLRPSEQARLSELLSGVDELEDIIRTMIVDRVAIAAATFAKEFPDAPRAGSEPKPD